ncbi:hypothetical protein Moror_11909 [Moniliophthora roreri MCA 2997]|uniref:Uncharacterized protein n=1 Tax=Moniliophthora roreri (strain MCA 2997) TaxID=1381753 RepID=V2WZV1_MONRO|nr:hypothetical protein Moror_11909 [Moniliophthora roreri MCA 2997]
MANTTSNWSNDSASLPRRNTFWTQRNSGKQNGHASFPSGPLYWVIVEFCDFCERPTTHDSGPNSIHFLRHLFQGSKRAVQKIKWKVMFSPTSRLTPAESSLYGSVSWRPSLSSLAHQ